MIHPVNMIDVSVVSRKLVKPCTPTPRNLKNYDISFVDELSPTFKVAFLLFFRSKPKGMISQLEESLAKILAEFYPLAGRYINKDHLVDCNDEGAEFIQAEAVGVELMDLVGTKTTEQLNHLFPPQFFQVDQAANDPLLSIQITEFKSCGGLAIAISVYHRILDAYSVRTFIAAWSNACSSNPGGKMITTISPNFDSPLLFPSNKINNQNNSHPDDHVKPSKTSKAPKIVVKRFSFNMESITSLRSKLRRNDGKRGGMMISRVRVVSALIAKALIGVDRAKHGGESRSCIIGQAVNMRDRTIPPLPKHSCGNLIIGSFTRCIGATETNDIGIQQLIDLIGDAIEKTIADCAQVFCPGSDPRSIFMDAIEHVKELKLESGDINVVMFSDWSKYRLYEADSGWGKPVWASMGPIPREKLTVLMEKKDGDGIDAWVHLNQNDMHYFEQDEEIRLFTT